MPPSEFKYVVLDVFTTEPFTGNQLAIVHLRDEHALTRERRHQIVREFNFSETVFLYDLQPGAAGRKMEIWTPEAELPFAGESCSLVHCHWPWPQPFSVDAGCPSVRPSDCSDGLHRRCHILGNAHNADCESPPLFLEP